MFQEPTDVADAESRLALDCLEAGIRAAEPSTVVTNHVSLDGTELLVDGHAYDLAAHDRVLVGGGGNAAGTAAQELESVLGHHVDAGAVVTDTPVETERIDVLAGDHPVPSERGVENTRRVLETAASATDDDLLIGIVTGGGSALLAAPSDGIELADLQTVTDQLLASGADIGEINAVRKHCSDLKGGQLAAAAAPATVLGLVFSDVVGNRLDVIASGPLEPDESTFGEALDVLERYGIDAPDAVVARLREGANGECPETPVRGDPAFESVHQHVLADATTALRGAAETARDAGYDPLILGSRVRGEAREAAKVLVGIAEESAATGAPVEPPAVILSGGETTVTIRGDGTGGPNQEFVLSAALEVTAETVTVACVDTDGIDGNSDAAGAIGSAETAEPREEARGALEVNDAGTFLERRDALLVTGPTGTNVNDLRVLVVPGD